MDISTIHCFSFVLTRRDPHLRGFILMLDLSILNGIDFSRKLGVGDLARVTYILKLYVYILRP